MKRVYGGKICERRKEESQDDRLFMLSYTVFLHIQGELAEYFTRGIGMSFF